MRFPAEYFPNKLQFTQSGLLRSPGDSGLIAGVSSMITDFRWAIQLDYWYLRDTAGAASLRYGTIVCILKSEVAESVAHATAIF
jgi:hypothetical protein